MAELSGKHSRTGRSRVAACGLLQAVWMRPRVCREAKDAKGAHKNADPEVGVFM
jgi:hypothetical protein